jgi:hypothetical protein
MSSAGRVVLGCALLAFAAGCGSADSASGPAGTSGRTSAPKRTETSGPPSSAHRTPAKFPHPTRIDSKWFPLVPGAQFTLQGQSNRGEGLLPHRVVLTVTDLTKVINGVRTRVLWERDLDEDELVEAELAFHAQDEVGNIWNFGEYPEEYENGKFHGAPSVWIAGVVGTDAGIVVPGRPRVGTPSFRQGWAPTIKFADKGQVSKMGQRTCVPVGCYRNVLVIDEWDALEPDAGHQIKFYAPNVGSVRVEPSGGEEQETLVLAKVEHLDAKAMGQARAAALKLEAHAYEISAVYRKTEHIKPGP